MKNNLKSMVLFILLNVSAVSFAVRANAQDDNSGPPDDSAPTYQTFYNELSPYGQWVNDPTYGYVWVPGVDANFYPYGTDGHWVFTDFGWTWVSDFPWGWAPFHYGRWFFHSRYGWIWTPGDVWGPAWVVWRHSPGYFGWAPLAPGISLTVAMGGGWNLPSERWRFVPEKYIDDPHVYNYYVRPQNNTTIIRNSTVINKTVVDNVHHTTYIAGPEKTDVEHSTGRTITKMNVQESPKPAARVESDHVTMYRAEVAPKSRVIPKPAPQKVFQFKQVTPIKKRQTMAPAPKPH